MAERLLRRLVAREPRPPAPHAHPRLRRRIEAVEAECQALRNRVAELEDGLQEQRSLSPRIAELTDLVTTLLAAATQGQDAWAAELDRLTRQDQPRTEQEPGA